MKPRHLLPILLALAALPLISRADAPEPKSDDAAYIAVATSRAKAELALKKAHNLVDENRSGWNAAWQNAELTRNKTYAVLEKAIESEEKKDEIDRNKNLLDQMHDRLDSLHQTWDAYQAKERNDLNNSYHDVGETVDNLARILDATAGLDRSWKDAGLDLAALQSNYDAITKRANETADAAQKVLSQIAVQQKTWEADLDAAQKLASAKPNP